MKKSIALTALLGIALFLIGCTTVSKPVTVGDQKITYIERTNLGAPSVTTVVSTDPAGHSKIVQSFSEHGVVTSLAPSAISAVGNVMASERFGRSLEPDQTNVSAAGGGGGQASNTVDQSKKDNSFKGSTSNVVNQSNTNNINVGK